LSIPEEIYSRNMLCPLKSLKYLQSTNKTDLTKLLMVKHVSGINFFRYAQGQMIGMPNNLKVCGIKTSKVPKQDSQSRLM
jgi:hypothetical protein